MWPGPVPAAQASGRACAGGRRRPPPHASAVDVCEAAQMLGRRCGYDPEYLTDIGCVLEYWDGKGFPGAVRGEEIPAPARVVQVASLAVAAHRAVGVSGAVELVGAAPGPQLGAGRGGRVPRRCGAAATSGAGSGLPVGAGGGGGAGTVAGGRRRGDRPGAAGGGRLRGPRRRRACPSIRPASPTLAAAAAQELGLPDDEVASRYGGRGGCTTSGGSGSARPCGTTPAH